MNQSNHWPYRLMAPGPVQVLDEAREALSEPMIHHRTPQFTEILNEVLENLKYAFQTKQPVMMHTSTGSGAMEAAIVNTLSPGDEVLAIASGKFGERWADISEVYGMKVHRMNVPWGTTASVDEVKTRLAENANIKAVLCQACETSTAVVHPIKEIAEIIKDREQTLFMVDGITALGAMPLPMDEWNIDVLVAGSQKAFMLPTGLAFIALSQKAWKMNEEARCPRYYFDLQRERKANEKGQTFFSSSVALIKGLRPVLAKFKSEGLEAQIHRCQLLAEATRQSMQALGLKLFAQSPSPSVTAVFVPAGVDGGKLRGHIEKKYNITLMGGQDQLKGRILRIGHLGAISDEDLLATVKAIGLSLMDMGWSSTTEDKIQTALKTAQSILTESP